ncbi:MAG TPA: hypothetical protein PLO20_14810 [Thermogutta sp.]|nr:hypothetical protein [Thermogutta sp.]
MVDRDSPGAGRWGCPSGPLTLTRRAGPHPARWRSPPSPGGRGEAVDGGTADLVAWTLTDHLSTVRDIAKYDPQMA